MIINGIFLITAAPIGEVTEKGGLPPYLFCVSLRLVLLTPNRDSSTKFLMKLCNHQRLIDICPKFIENVVCPTCRGLMSKPFGIEDIWSSQFHEGPFLAQTLQDSLLLVLLSRSWRKVDMNHRIKWYPDTPGRFYRAIDKISVPIRNFFPILYWLDLPSLWFKRTWQVIFLIPILGDKNFTIPAQMERPANRGMIIAYRDEPQLHSLNV